MSTASINGSTRSAFRFFRAAVPAGLLFGLVLAACQSGDKSIEVKREALFTLSYGAAEDQLDLFQLEGSDAPLKTRIAMQKGIFYIANGNAAKMLRFSSFGDILSMVYNPDRNPEPQILKPMPPGQQGQGGAGRNAVAYPLNEVGEIAVDSDQTIYVEERLPQERRVQDKESGAILDYVVLRFSRDGQFIDYLGQEGLGGTPFPYILGVYANANDDCVVVSMTQAAWLIHWFDSKGLVLASVRLRRDAMPLPEKSEGLIASLDTVIPDPQGRFLLLKVDYYRETKDPATKAVSGIEFDSSWVYKMDMRDASYADRWRIPVTERSVKDSQTGQVQRYVRIPELLGAAGSVLFFISPEEDGKTYVSTFDRSDQGMNRFSIDIALDELLYSSFYVSREGILCALLGSKFEARVVWWRFDKLLKIPGSGFGA